jgi:hypothetical protein
LCRHLAVLGVIATAASVHATEPLANHYNDPFRQVSSAIAACPTPRGPLMTLAEANAEAHQRIERGTTCFQAGKCKTPNAYQYDPQIAKHAAIALERALQSSPELRRSSVWITVQRRFIFVQGCVSNARHVKRLENVLRALPDVQYVSADMAIIRGDKIPARLPYPTLSRR